MCSDPWGAGGPCQPLPWSQEKGCSTQWDQGWAWTPPAGSPGCTQGQVSPAKTLHDQSLPRSGIPPVPDPGPS